MPFGFDAVLDKFSEAGKAIIGSFTQENEDEGERQGSKSSQTAISTQVRSSQDYVPHRTDRSIMEKDDDDVVHTGSSRINPVAIDTSRPPRRTNAYKASSGDREEIKDLFPEPPAPRRPAAPRMTASNSTQASSDRREERKFFGTQAPKHATPIKVPGSESPAPVSSGLRKKPGAERRVVPRNTLDQTKSEAASRYQGSARPPGPSSTQRARAATKHPNALDYETSRGANVRNDFDFPDGRSPKRQKTEPSQRTVQKPRLEQVFDSIQEKNAVNTSQAINPQLFRPPPKAAPRSMNWEVSGTQEFNRVEETIRRPPREERKTRRHDEVVDISDDEPAAPLTATVTAKRGRGRPAKKQKVDGANVVEIVEGDFNEVNGRSRAQNDHLSPYFRPNGGATQRQMATKQAIDPDEVQRNPMGLAAGVHAALSSSQKPQQQEPDEDNVYSIEDSVEEADGVQENGRPKRRASSDVKAEMEALEDDVSEDELHADIPTSFPNRRSQASHVTASGSKQRRPGQKLSAFSWPIEEFKDEDGRIFNGFNFLEVNIRQGIAANHVRFRDPESTSGENLHVIEFKHIRGVQTSKDPNCVFLRIICSGNPQPLTDIKFRDHGSLADFVDGLQHVTTIKDIILKESAFMSKIYHLPRKQTKLSIDRAVDAGAEEALLARRRGMSPPKTSSTRLTTEGGRPRQRQTLISQLTAEEKPASNAKGSRLVEGPKRTYARNTSPTDDDALASTGRPVRATRQRKIREPTPEPVFKKYSDDPGLGGKWDQPVIYPEVGRKRVTINFEDLFRLDDGEFLNDNLIEFYLRWLQVNRTNNVKEKTAYFFGTHFFSTVSDTSSMNKSATVRNKSINYAAVERWTAKENLFDYDFVVVPINESAHWYLAIICNLPQVKKKLESQDTQETSEVSQNAENYQEKGSQSHPVNISESAEDLENVQVPDSQSTPVYDTATVPAASVEQDRDECRASTPTKGATQQIDNLSLASPKSASASAPTEPAGVEDESGKMVDAEAASQELLSNVPKEEPTKIEDPEKGVSQIPEGVLGNAAPPSPEKKKKGKRKSGPGLKKYPSDHLAIVTIDPMGTPHGRAVSVLKDYLIEEASMKHGMEITKDMFQGMTARKGIPQQSNYYDCGVFVCGYMDKFMQDPYKFGEKLLLQEFEEDDWPEMQPGKMRDQMREMLQNLAKDQKQDRATKRAEKRALKTMKPVTAKDAHLSSPLKQMGMGNEPKEQVEPEPALPPRVARSPSIPTTVQETQEDEMIMRPEAATQPQPLSEPVAGKAQEPQSSDWKQAIAPGDSTQASQESAASTGSVESLDRQVVAGGMKFTPFQIHEDRPSQEAGSATQDSVIVVDTQEASRPSNDALEKLADKF